MLKQKEYVTGHLTEGDQSSNIVIAGQSGKDTFLTSIVISNTSAADNIVTLTSGTTIRLVVAIAAGVTFTLSLPTPMPPEGKEADWIIEPSTDPESTGNIECTLTGYYE